MLQIPPTLPEVQSVRRNEPVARPIAAPVVAEGAATEPTSVAGAAVKINLPVIQPGDSNKAREALQRTPIAAGAAEAAEAEVDAEQALSQWLRQTGGVTPGGLPERMARLLAQLATAASQGQPGQPATWPSARQAVADTPQARTPSETPGRTLERPPSGQPAAPTVTAAPVASGEPVDSTSAIAPRGPVPSTSPALGDTPRQALEALRQQLADSPLFDLHRLRDVLMPALRQTPPQSHTQAQAQAQAQAQPQPASQAGVSGQAMQQGSAQDPAAEVPAPKPIQPQTPRPTAAAQHMAAVAALLPQSTPEARSAAEIRNVLDARPAAGALSAPADDWPAQVMSSEPLPAMQLRQNSSSRESMQATAHQSAPVRPSGAVAGVAVAASESSRLAETELARPGAETGGLAGRVAEGPRLDAQALRQALQVLMQGALQWQGELTPGVRAKLLREEAWDRDPDAPGQVAKGAQISVELELPNMGTLRIAGLQIQESVRLRIMPVAQSREFFGAALDDLRTHLDVAGLPAAQVVLDEGATS